MGKPAVEGDRSEDADHFGCLSLIDAFGELANRFEEQNPGVKVKQSFESSSTLLTRSTGSTR